MGYLDLAYRGESGTVIAEMASVDQSVSFVSPVPLTCRGNRDLFMPFWRTDGDWQSSLVLRNIASEENQAEIRISYPGGKYLLEQEIPAGSSVMVSVNELQQSQRPDRSGNRIPAGAEMGGMNIWSRNVDDGLVINPMVLNPTTATCGSCPGDGYVTSVLPIEDYADYSSANGFQIHYPGDQFGVQFAVLWLDGMRASAPVAQLASDTGTVATTSGSLVTVIDEGIAEISANTTRPVPTDSACTMTIDSGGNPVNVACLLPTGEGEIAGQWIGPNMDWYVQLKPGSRSFAGRIVAEQDPGGGGPDGCWFSNSIIPLFIHLNPPPPVTLDSTNSF